MVHNRFHVQYLCNNDQETSYVFLSCPFACNIWTWLSQIIRWNIDLSSYSFILCACDRGWSLQVKDVILAAILNVFYTI